MATFGLWQYTIDRDATAAAYARVERGRSDECTCNGCRNFVAAREHLYPEEFLRFLASLGIDHRKDGEVYHNARLEPGRHDYGGWFHFVGSLDTTGDFPVVHMGKGFSVWLKRKTSPELAALKDLPLVEVEFHSENVPWVLDEAEAL